MTGTGLSADGIRRQEWGKLCKRTDTKKADGSYRSYERKDAITVWIRQEEPKDYQDVYTLVKTAFSTADHCDGNEQDLVAALRQSDAFLPQLSLVAEQNGNIVGHIMFTKAKVGPHTVLVLAPLSVLPQNQKQGVGAALIREGHKIAKGLNYQYVLVLGSETYYPRFGYVPAEQLGIRAPFSVASENFMAIRLKENAVPLSGTVTYAPEFGL